MASSWPPYLPTTVTESNGIDDSNSLLSSSSSLFSSSPYRDTTTEELDDSEWVDVDENFESCPWDGATQNCQIFSTGEDDWAPWAAQKVRYASREIIHQLNEYLTPPDDKTPSWNAWLGNIVAPGLSNDVPNRILTALSLTAHSPAFKLSGAIHGSELIEPGADQEGYKKFQSVSSGSQMEKNTMRSFWRQEDHSYGTMGVSALYVRHKRGHVGNQKRKSKPLGKWQDHGERFWASSRRIEGRETMRGWAFRRAEDVLRRTVPAVQEARSDRLQEEGDEEEDEEELDSSEEEREMIRKLGPKVPKKAEDRV